MTWLDWCFVAGSAFGSVMFGVSLHRQDILGLGLHGIVWFYGLYLFAKWSELPAYEHRCPRCSFLWTGQPFCYGCGGPAPA